MKWDEAALCDVESQFLSGIAEPHKEVILKVAKSRNVIGKSTLIYGGAKATHLFLLRSGNARYYRLTSEGTELLLRWLVPGDVFGLATLLKQPPAYMGTVETENDCSVYTWTHAELRELSHLYPQLAENALRIALGYLSAYSDRHAGLVTKTAEQRLACSLVRLGHRAGRTHPKGIQVDITNEQL